jgi:hypothetical protein
MASHGTSPLSARLRAHIEELLAEHLIRGDYRPDLAPAADPGRRVVALPFVTGRDTYFTALAQIATVAVGAEGHRGERDPWGWALDHAITPPTERTRERIAKPEPQIG